MKIGKKLLFIMIIIMLVIMFGTRNAYSVTNSGRVEGYNDLVDDKYTNHNVGKLIVLASHRDLEDATKRNKIENVMGKKYGSLIGGAVLNMGRADHHTYCVQHGADNVLADMRIKHYFKIQGNDMVEHMYSAKNDNGTYRAVDGTTYDSPNKHANAILAYILTRDVNSTKCNWSKWTKSAVQTDDNGQNAVLDGPRQLAVKMYWNDWLSEASKSKSISNDAWAGNNEINSSLRYFSNAQNAVREAKGNYKVAEKAQITATENNVSGTNPALSVKYSGEVKSVIVKDLDNNTIASSDIEFYTDAAYKTKISMDEIPNNGRKFYIKNKSNQIIKSVDIRVGKLTYQVELWLLESTGCLGGENLRDSGDNSICQKLMTVKESKVTTGANTVINYNYKGSLIINKKDSITKKPIKNNIAKFKIQTPTGKWLSGDEGSYNYNHATGKVYSTNQNGVLQLKGLTTFGEYMIKEVTPPSGYNISTESKKIIVNDESNANLNQTIDFFNTPEGSIKITKKDLITKNAIKNNVAKFKIQTPTGKWLSGEEGSYNYNHETGQTYSTDNNGVLELKGLTEFGTYKIKEITAPDGYHLATNIEEVAISSSKLNQSIDFMNDPKGSLTIYKYDYEDTKEKKTGLIGAGFKIRVEGKGWLKNNTAPYDYDATFKDATIYKLQEDYDNSKTITYPVNSNEYEDGLRIDGLDDGEYYIYEVEAPNGYVLESQNDYKVEDGMEYVHNSNWKREIPYTNTEGKTTKSRGIAITNKKTGSLTIYKNDSDDTMEKKTGLVGAGFKIRVKGKGWLKNNTAPYVYDATFEDATIYKMQEDYNKSKTITYPVKSDEYGNGLKIDGLNYGEYYIYEVKAPNGYVLETQNNYKVEDGMEYVHNSNWKREIPHTNKEGKTTRARIIAIKNKKTGSLTIYKRDSEQSENDLKGYLQAGFKIQINGGGWLANTTAPYNYNATFENATIYRLKDEYRESNTIQYPYKSNDWGDGLRIEGLKEGTYKVFEVEAPEGYKLEQQRGYKKEEVTIKVNGQNKKVTREYADIGNNERTISFDESKWNDYIKKDVGMALQNYKPVSIEGIVWVDTRIGKQNDTNGVYTSNDTVVEGITVKLMKKKPNATGNKEADFEQVGESQKTDSSGKYLFKDAILKSDIYNCYVEFNYNGVTTKVKNLEGNLVDDDISKYIPVKFDITKKNSSKAMMPTVAKYDVNLSGYARTSMTSRDKYGISKCGTYTESTRTYSDVNLGIKKIPEADYSITQNLAYVKIDMKGFKFTYNYGGTGNTSMIAAPKTNWQKKGTISGYTADIYPSDIAYSNTQTDMQNKIKVYVVYRIDIKNTMDYNVNELYVEDKLKLKKLTNYYDGNRYTIEKVYDVKENNNVTKDFNNWSNAFNTTRNGKDVKMVTYDLDKFKDGIEKNETKTAFIEFKVNDDAISKILENPAGIIEGYPTEAESIGYHEYKRNDYSWTNLNANKNPSEPTEPNHITKNDTRSDAAPYLIFKVDKDRTIKGKVFEDKPTQRSINAGEKIGNGKYDSNENNIKGVKVDLIEVPNNSKNLSELTADQIKNLQPATRYPQDQAHKPRVTNESVVTNNYGNYELPGVVPGKYVVRFTYGDGSQKVYDTSGKEISSVVGEKYKSTIVTEEHAKEALNGGTDQEWYKDITGNNSVAIDNLNTRKNVNDATNEQIQNGESKVMAGSAKISINLENYPKNIDSVNLDKNNSNQKYNSSLVDSSGNVVDKDEDNNQIYIKYLNVIKAENNFEGLSFGIIEVPKQNAEIKKVITNVKLVDSEGRTLYNGNPENVPSQGVVALSDLDNEANGGSTYVRAEIAEVNLYGSKLELTYEVRITNLSDINYYDDKYYWYGTPNTKKEVTLTPTEVMDYLDNSLTYEVEKSKQLNNDVERIIQRDAIDKKFDGKSIKVQPCVLNRWKALYTNKNKKRDKSKTTDKVSIVASRILSSNDEDMEVISRAEITRIERTPDPADTTTPENEKKEQVKIAPKEVHTNGMVQALFTITPPTGENRSTTIIFAISTTITLIMLAIGIGVIKKKVSS